MREWELDLKFACVGITLVAALASAQQRPLPNAPSASRTLSETAVQKKEQSQRMFGVVPMFHITSRQNARALTAGQKFRLFAKGTLDPFQFLSVGIAAGITQANNDFAEYGQGAAGYGKRFGAAFADEVSGSMFGSFVYPVLLKQDPRYFRRGKGGFGRRVGYALAQEFVCRSDGGRTTFNASRILGALTASGISNAYYPQADRGLGSTLNRTGTALLNGSLGGLLNEFWPEIEHTVLHKSGARD